ncbi:hypothetical protein CEXT_522201 [Caerostris extrusa]|uniref:Uncharacterized protein n=1 Tax=Caerostris extrusa TaxID=172846 RepID=A0AAV4S2E2_CAEEX|nr:hypothetical protein CEXT_522201 [Caerostris extrusa]
MSVIYGLYHIKTQRNAVPFLQCPFAECLFGISLALAYFLLSYPGMRSLSTRYWPLRWDSSQSSNILRLPFFHPLIMTWYFNSQMTPFFTHTNMVSNLVI